MTFHNLLKTPEDLEIHYGEVRRASTSKVCDQLTTAMQRWLEHSTFFVISTASDTGIDCSPRGDTPGEAFRILNEHSLAIPDRRGNNRIESLRNLLADPRIGLLFLVPGVNEALRVKGTASICVDPTLLDSFRINDEKRPASVILVNIESVYVQNDRAIKRSELWHRATKTGRREIPDATELSLRPANSSE